MKPNRSTIIGDDYVIEESSLFPTENLYTILDSYVDYFYEKSGDATCFLIHGDTRVIVHVHVPTCDLEGRMLLGHPYIEIERGDFRISSAPSGVYDGKIVGIFQEEDGNVRIKIGDMVWKILYRHYVEEKAYSVRKEVNIQIINQLGFHVGDKVEYDCSMIIPNPIAGPFISDMGLTSLHFEVQKVCSSPLSQAGYFFVIDFELSWYDGTGGEGVCTLQHSSGIVFSTLIPITSEGGFHIPALITGYPIIRPEINVLCPSVLEEGISKDGKYVGTIILIDGVPRLRVGLMVCKIHSSQKGKRYYDTPNIQEISEEELQELGYSIGDKVEFRGSNAMQIEEFDFINRTFLSGFEVIKYYEDILK